MLVCGMLGVDQRLDVGWIFDLRATVVTSPVAGKNIGTVGDTNLMAIGEHGQNASDMGVRDRVIVEIEADIGCLADRHG